MIMHCEHAETLRTLVRVARPSQHLGTSWWKVHHIVAHLKCIFQQLEHKHKQCVHDNARLLLHGQDLSELKGKLRRTVFGNIRRISSPFQKELGQTLCLTQLHQIHPSP